MWIQDHQQSVDNIDMQLAANGNPHSLFVNLILLKFMDSSQVPSGWGHENC